MAIARRMDAGDTLHIEAASLIFTPSRSGAVLIWLAGCINECLQWYTIKCK